MKIKIPKCKKEKKSKKIKSLFFKDFFGKKSHRSSKEDLKNLWHRHRIYVYFKHMKPTAIQWLLKILEGQKDKPFDYDEWKIAFEHALEMEKEQIMNAYYQIGKDHPDMIFPIEKDAEQYYNETYKSE